ncbi:hypothetical protein GGI04_000808 [Coemansia thaxteri]|nr:hypothetical protein GGI04_000808 [Coemansia thaxteri]
MLLSPDQIAFFHAHGYLIVDCFLTPKEVQLYWDEAQQLVNHCYELGDILSAWGCVIEPLGCDYYDDDQLTCQAKTSRTSYVSLRTQSAPLELPLCTLDKFGQCAKQLLTRSPLLPAFLLNEQYIAKPPRSIKAEFAWHQDVLYFSELQRQHEIISVWTPLSNVSDANGTVLVDPFPDPFSSGRIMRDNTVLAAMAVPLG